MEEAELRAFLAKAADAGLERLNLRGRGLTTLPGEIGNLRDLRFLDLSENRLTTLPPEIGQLRQLAYLSVAVNHLVTLPAEMEQLTQLVSLSLADNWFSLLPAAVGNLRALRTLSLANNQLQGVPAEIWQLAELKRLHLNGNQLATLPAELGQLRRLEQLDLSNNQLTTLPAETGQLRQLQDLDLDRNQLTALPAEIGQLRKLQALYLGHNQLTSLPAEIGQLLALLRANLRYNQLTALPTEIGQLDRLTWLHLRGNSLTTLPAEIGQLHALQRLDLGFNQLTVLPAEIGQVHELQRLDLRNNQLTALPVEVGQLHRLMDLYLRHNGLTTLPAEIGQLLALLWLDLNDNQLTALPTEIGQLRELQVLELNNNQLTALPTEIGQLRELTRLGLDYNELTALPAEIGRLHQLTRLSLVGIGLTALPVETRLLRELRELRLDRNPELRFPPAEIVALGLQGIQGFLWAAEAGSEEVWESKLLLVGEGGVGKTCLYNALNGKLATGVEPGTVGIDVGPVELVHPSHAGQSMRLNCWDFAGQDFNHAVHQFFFNDRSLFLLVWNARHGWQQGKLRQWLENIEARAPQARVVLVQTHIDQPHAGYPEATLRADYSQIVATAAVSNTTGEGIDALREMLQVQSAELPLMGLRWPASWLAAARAVRALRDEEGLLHASEQRVLQIIEQQGLERDQAKILLRWLHQRGDVLHFAKELHLSELVILEPEWLTKHVGQVLRSDEVLRQKGVLNREHLNSDLWSDLDGWVREHFLRMMDQFDLAYLIPEDPLDRSLIVERVPLDPPEYGPAWEAFAGQPEIALRYRLESMQPGIPTWFIARCHRFTMRLHWLQGVLFKDEEDRHRALVIADERERAVEMRVRGPFPARFMALLQDGFQDTLRRYEGLKVERFVPCPGFDELSGTPCRSEFDLDKLEQWIVERPQNTHFDCPECGTRHMRLKLVEGIGPAALTEEYSLQRTSELIEAAQKAIVGTVVDQAELTRAHIDRSTEDIIAYHKRNFLLKWQREQEEELVTCPNLLTLQPVGRRGLVTEGEFVVQLYCQYHRGWHSVAPAGRYQVKIQKEWVRRSLPYLKTLHKALKVAVPLGGAALDVAGDAAAWAADQHSVLENEFELFDTFLKSSELLLPGDEPLGETTERIEARGSFRAYAGAELVPVRELLDGLAERDRKDGKPVWGGLTRRRMPEGEIVWLCGEHLALFESKRKAISPPPDMPFDY